MRKDVPVARLVFWTNRTIQQRFPAELRECVEVETDNDDSIAERVRSAMRILCASQDVPQLKPVPPSSRKTTRRKVAARTAVP